MADNASGSGDGLTAEQRTQIRVAESKTAWILWSIIGVVTVVSLVGVFLLLGGNSERIANAAYARGVITVLFSVGVVAMALIVVLSVLMQKQDPDGAGLSEKRFQRAKEILSLLLGILGTVVGFYFGTSTTITVGDFNIGGILVSDQSPDPGSQVELTVLIEGGRPPFRYQIAFAGLDIAPIKGETSEQWIKEQFSIPAEIGEARKLTATIEITDAAENRSVLSREFELGEGPINGYPLDPDDTTNPAGGASPPQYRPG